MNKVHKRLRIQIVLFVVTLITTTLAGAEWMLSKSVLATDEHMMRLSDFIAGLEFSIPFLLILTCHEFGHFFTAKYYKIRVTLPYYIPLWLGFLGMPSFGTMGALIRIKDTIYSLKHYFDVGVAGPLAGFVVAVAVIGHGYAHLPAPEYIFEVHPEYEQYGLDYPDHVYTYEFRKTQDALDYVKYRAADSLAAVEKGEAENWGYPEFTPLEAYPSMYFGKPLLYLLIEKYLISERSNLISDQEIMHNPYLLAGLLALFFTALNLLPVGQLDGGHIIFGLFGASSHRLISRVLFTAFLFYSGLGLVTVADLANISGGAVLEFLLILFGYLYFLYVCAYSMFREKQNRWMFAAIMLASQFLVHLLFHVEGYSGWLLFGLLLGRFLGVDHPPVADLKPLSPGRKVIGWIALVVFILSFCPEPFVFDFVTRN